MSRASTLFLMAAFLFLTACGGGGAGGNSAASTVSSSSVSSSRASSASLGASSSAGSSFGSSANSNSNSSSSLGSSSASSGGSARVLLFENFNSATLPTALGLWAGGATLELVSDAAQTYGGSGKSLKATYAPMAAPGGAQYPGGSLSLLPYNTDHVYIRFRAKMPQHKHGLKFVKVFGQNESGGYANTTFGLDYTGNDAGSMYCTSFGDGTGVANDTASILTFSGAGYPGRAAGLPGFAVSTPQNKNFASSDWGTGWHLFEFYVKFNSGTSAANEKNDGAVQVKIDGKVYVDAKGLFNRHYSNKLLDRIEILGWSQNSSIEEFISGSWIRRELATPSFEIWYDNIEISLDGWGASPI